MPGRNQNFKRTANILIFLKVKIIFKKNLKICSYLSPDIIEYPSF